MLYKLINPNNFNGKVKNTQINLGFKQNNTRFNHYSNQIGIWLKQESTKNLLTIINGFSNRNIWIDYIEMYFQS